MGKAGDVSTGGFGCRPTRIPFEPVYHIGPCGQEEDLGADAVLEVGTGDQERGEDVVAEAVAAGGYS